MIEHAGDDPQPQNDAPSLRRDLMGKLYFELAKFPLWSSMVKDTMKRKRPAFAERAYGYRSFSDLLEDAQKRGFITLRTDPTSGTYVMVGFAKAGR